MNGQNCSIDRLGSRTTRRNSVKDIRDIAGNILEDGFSWFDHGGPLVVEGAFSEIRVFYICRKTSSSDQHTFVDFRVHFDSRRMWIGFIQVAACHRLQGVGRQLVKVVETTANVLGMEEARILPLTSAIDFWLKLDYVPHPRMTRVLWKNLADVEENSDRLHGQFDVLE